MNDLLAMRVELPAWIAGFRAGLPACLETPEQRMEVAIDLSRQNVLAGSGGPFGAVVVAEDSGEVVALGVNRVEPGHCSSAHAEIVALSMAQRLAADWDLGRHPASPLQLVSSCEPCAMCLGAIPWSGLASVLCGATKADAEAAGFDEGDRPDRWLEKMAARGIRVHIGLMRAEAAAVLDLYARSGKTIYGPDSKGAGK